MKSVCGMLLACVVAVTACQAKKDKTQSADTKSSESEKATAKAASAVKSAKPSIEDPASMTATAPPAFKVKFETTAGDLVFACKRDWAPHGVDRIYNLAKAGFYNDVAMFRAVEGFVIQFGIHGDPSVSAKWRDANLKPDPVKESNRKGTLTYAMAGSPTTRTTQLFINLNDNSRLDSMGFAPVCEIADGEDTLSKINKSYGERPSKQQMAIQTQGNAFLRSAFPDLDYIKTVSVIEE